MEQQQKHYYMLYGFRDKFVFFIYSSHCLSLKIIQYMELPNANTANYINEMTKQNKTVENICINAGYIRDIQH